MYKLIAIDIDGTLINSYGEITNENKNAVKKANEAGVKIVLPEDTRASEGLPAVPV